MTTCFWWRGDARTGPVNNLGDALSPILLQHFSDITVTWTPPEDADLVCCGSVLDVLPTGYAGTVVGSGQLHNHTLTDLTFATVLGLRGALSRMRVECGDQNPVLADPGLLASELVTPVPNSIEIGVVPHWSDRELWLLEQTKAMRGKYAMPTLIDPTGDPLEVIAAIGSCRKVVTSTLHGAVVADAFGIPRRVELAPAMRNDKAHEGSTFKFADYASTLGQPITFGKLQTAPQERVTAMQWQLFQMFQTLKGLHA